jgi:hypothetical protein
MCGFERLEERYLKYATTGCMRIQPEIDHKIRREIHDARAKDPLISVVALQEQLEKQFSRTFSRKYIAKLAVKVERQGLIEADRTKLEGQARRRGRTK